MDQSDYQYAQAKLAQLKADYQVDVASDWGDNNGAWNSGTWTKAELDKLQDTIALLANALCGNDKFIRYLGGVTIKKADIG